MSKFKKIVEEYFETRCSQLLKRLLKNKEVVVDWAISKQFFDYIMNNPEVDQIIYDFDTKNGTTTDTEAFRSERQDDGSYFVWIE